MKSYSSIIIFVLLNIKSLTLLAQENLFPNPSFEEYTACFNTQSKDSFKLTTDWSQPTLDGMPSTNICDDDFWRPYIRATLEARTGLGVQYVLMYYNDTRAPLSDYRSYVVAKLKKPLTANSKYFFKMYMRCIFNTLKGFCKTNNQAIAFTEKYPKDVPLGVGLIPLTPSFQTTKTIDTFWTEISGCLTAKGGEEYAIIGNFKKKDSTAIQPFVPINDNPVLLGSYMIEDVQLVPLNLDIPSDTTICQGETLFLNPKTYLPATFKWQDGTTTPQYRVTKAGTYSVMINYVINNQNCTTEQQITVNVLPRYVPLKMVDTTICYEKSILLKVGKGRSDDTITWQDNSTKDTLRVSKTGVYTAQINNACGQYKENYKVNFVNCAIEIYVPNAFSPNGDNQNETLNPFIHTEFPITDYEFSVFNRWGSLVFKSTDQNGAWDGTFNGKALLPDVYVWTLRIKANVGGKLILREEAGNINLVR